MTNMGTLAKQEEKQRNGLFVSVLILGTIEGKEEF